MSLTILGPEVILGLEFPQILARIYHSGIFVVDFLIGLLNEEQIELLYKYHVPDSFLATFRLKNVYPGGEDYAHLAKSVPVRNWRLLRRSFELGPSFVDARDKAVTEIKRAKLEKELAERQTNNLALQR